MNEGLDYFPLSTSFNDRFEYVEEQFGLTGYAVMIKLFQRIYGGKGFYTPFDDRAAALFARKNGIDEQTLLSIVLCAVEVGIFDRRIYEEYRVLTGQGVQKRYFGAIKKRFDAQGLKQAANYVLPEYQSAVKTPGSGRERKERKAGESKEKKEEKEEKDNKEKEREKERKEEEKKEKENLLSDDVVKEIKEPFKSYYRRRFSDWCAAKKVILPESVMYDWYKMDLEKYGEETLKKTLISDGPFITFDVDEFFDLAHRKTLERAKKEANGS